MPDHGAVRFHPDMGGRRQVDIWENPGKRLPHQAAGRKIHILRCKDCTSRTIESQCGRRRIRIHVEDGDFRFSCRIFGGKRQDEFSGRIDRTGAVEIRLVRGPIQKKTGKSLRAADGLHPAVEIAGTEDIGEQLRCLAAGRNLQRDGILQTRCGQLRPIRKECRKGDGCSGRCRIAYTQPGE
jgi:hypothetical protein